MHVQAHTEADTDVPLPLETPFNNWREARMFAGPMPFTFSVTPSEVVIVEGIRQNWKPQPVEILRHEVPFLDEFSSAQPRLANAFVTRDIRYSWKRGRRESLQA